MVFSRIAKRFSPRLHWNHNYKHEGSQPVKELFLQYKITNCPNNRTISRDICTRFARYLYSTECSWINIFMTKAVRGSITKINQSDYRIYSIKRPRRLLNFWTLRVGAYSRWAFIRGWALIKFSPFSASSKFILQQNNK